jgi:glycolate oxidase
LKHGALDVFVAESAKDKEKVWEPRKKTSEALKTLTNPVAREDLVVPKDKIPVLLKKLKECATRHEAQLYAFGHLGDGNIHADFAYPKEKSIRDGQLEDMRREVYQITLELGGAITAEHGVGLSKIRYVEMALGKTEVELMKHIKKLFDPQNILNPGKIFTNLSV